MGGNLLRSFRLVNKMTMFGWAVLRNTGQEHLDQDDEWHFLGLKAICYNMYEMSRCRIQYKIITFMLGFQYRYVLLVSFLFVERQIISQQLQANSDETHTSWNEQNRKENASKEPGQTKVLVYLRTGLSSKKRTFSMRLKCYYWNPGYRELPTARLQRLNIYISSLQRYSVYLSG